MKKLTRFGPFHSLALRFKSLMVVGLLLIIASIIGFSFYFSDLLSNKDPVSFDQVTYTNQECSFLISFLTESFASSGTSDSSQSNHYYLASDDSNLKIIRLQNDTYLKMKDILDYTYGKTEVIPEPILIKGVSRAIPEELMEFARQGYEELFSTSVSTEEVKQFLGQTMFVEDSQSSFSLVNFLFFFSLAFAGLFILSTNLNALKFLKKTLKEADENGLLARIENDFQLAKDYNQLSVLCNDDLIVCYANPVYLVPIDSIQEVHILRPSKFSSPLLCLEIIIKDQLPSLIQVRNSKKAIEQMDNLYNQILQAQQATQQVDINE